MQQLYYPNEIRSMNELDLGDGAVKDNELKMAVQLAEMSASDEFHPENYRDEVAERIRGLIQRKDRRRRDHQRSRRRTARAGHRSDGSTPQKPWRRLIRAQVHRRIGSREGREGCAHGKSHGKSEGRSQGTEARTATGRESGGVPVASALSERDETAAVIPSVERGTWAGGGA